MKVNIDLRKEVSGMMNSYAIDILCQKASKYFKCTCFEELHRSADPKCPKCRGTGKLVGIQRHRGIPEEFEPGAARSSVKRTEIGDAILQDIKLYIKHDTQLKIKDIIFTVGFNNDKAVTLHNVYEVTYVEPVRGDNGRIELVAIYAKAIPTYISTAKDIITKLRYKEIIQGRTYYV